MAAPTERMPQEERIDPEHRLGTDKPIERNSKDIIRGIFFGFLAICAVVGILYLSGVRQYFFYWTTPGTISQPPIESLTNAETITIPLSVIVFRNDEFYGSQRSENSIRTVVSNAANIWHQGHIDFVIKSISSVEKNDADLIEFQYKPGEFIRSLEQYDDSTINVLFISNLQGVNGLSFGGTYALAVADKTAVFDFRVLAHEIGHQLGLKHYDTDEIHLMSQGVNAYKLDLNEIEIARVSAKQFIEEKK